MHWTGGSGKVALEVLIGCIQKLSKNFHLEWPEKVLEECCMNTFGDG